MRKSDKKIFSLPRRFTRKRCKKGAKGFTMKASCAPYKDCKKYGSGKTKKTPYKKQSILSKIIAATKSPAVRVAQEKKYLLSTLADTNENKAHALNRSFERQRLIDDMNTKNFKKEQTQFDKSIKMISKSLKV